MVPEACAISSLPTSVEPVNVIFLTVGFDVISPPISRAEPVTMLMTPGGIPASSASNPQAIAE